jgi:ribosomal-protein-alanine N-acetyltransferase
MDCAPELITAPSIILRRATPEDAESLFGLAANPEVMRYMDWPMPADASATRQHLERMTNAWESRDEYQWVILDQHSGAMVGTIGVRPKGHAADFGYFLGRAFWGKGLATNAAAALLSWLDSRPEILRIWATVDLENARSRRLLERLELKLEGVMRCATFRPNIGGPPRGTAIYARTKTGFAKSRW